MRKGADCALTCDHFIGKCRLFAAQNALLFEQMIGGGSNEFCQKQGQRSEYHNEQRDLPVDFQHAEQGAENGGNAGE